MEDSRGTVERLKSGWIRLLLVMAVATCAVLFSARLIEIPSQSALRGWDNSFYLFWVRSAVIDGDLDFANEIDETNTLASKYVPLAKELPLTETGRVPNKYGIGWALSALPWFMAADATVAIANSTGITSMPRDGFGPVYQVYLQFGQLVYALVGLFALFKWLSLYFDRSDSKLGVVLLWLSSPLLYYQSTNLSMSHSLVFTLVSALLLLCATLPGSKRPLLKVATIGCLAGLCLVTRYQAFPFLLLPFVLFVKSLFEGNKESRVKLATALPLGVVAFLIPITLQVLAWKAVYGRWLIFTYGENGESFNWIDPELLNVLFHPYHGFFYWHPFMLLGLVGLVMAALRKDAWLIAGIVAFLATTYINAAWHTWNFGASFGHRGFTGILPLLAVGITWLVSIARTPARLKLLLGTGTTLAVWNIWLCILYCVDTIDRNGAVLPRDVLKGSAEFFRLAVTFFQ